MHPIELPLSCDQFHRKWNSDTIDLHLCFFVFALQIFTIIITYVALLLKFALALGEA